jgi:hypothetical protein
VLFRSNNSPEEFPKRLTDESSISIYFFVLFCKGGQENKPSEIYKKIVDLEYQPYEYDRETILFYREHGVTIQAPFDYSEYIQKNERSYYTGILKALLYPLGGGKTRKINREKKRKTNRKKT